MKHAIRQKLNSNRGASMIAALLLFMICTVIGTIILAAATVNSGKINNSAAEQQAYLDVRSAAWLLRDSCYGCYYLEQIVTTTVTTTVGSDGRPSNHVTVEKSVDEGDKNSIDQMLKDMANAVRKKRMLPEPRVLLIDQSQAEMDSVEATVTMDLEYNVTMTLHRKDKTPDYPMKLILNAAVEPDELDYSEIETDKATETDSLGQTVVTTVTTKKDYDLFKVEWKSYKIQKGGAA